jgi:hypothetical protein
MKKVGFAKMGLQYEAQSLCCFRWWHCVFEMRKAVVFTLAMCVVILGCVAYSERPSRVVPLTVKNFEEETATGTWVLELYALCLSFSQLGFFRADLPVCSFAPWCNHCQEYAKTYDEASLAVTTLKFGKIDCVAQQGVCCVSCFCELRLTIPGHQHCAHALE